MTVKQLIAELQNCDDDILEYEVGIVATIQLGRNTRLSTRFENIVVPENADTATKTLWLKGKNFVG